MIEVGEHPGWSDWRDDPELKDLVEWLELIETVCAEENVFKPEVQFRSSGHAQWIAYDDGMCRLKLPDPTWAIETDPECFGEGRYKLTVLHELAHHISWVRYRRDGHNDFMYAKLFQLCVRHDVDLGFAYENEIGYKPRAAKRGWNLFRRWALA